MDLSTLDWGSVPDYLAVFGIMGGIILGLRTWAKDRREQREQDAREREEQATGVALVVAYCIPPSRLGSLQRALTCSVESLAGVPVFDVNLKVRYVGGSNLVPPSLRELCFESSVITGEKSMRDLISIEEWPEIEYHMRDFTWELEFTDLHGKRWRRLPKGMPLLLQ
ncbi:phage holin family protein [Pseudarthrobacter oxydans]|uniref:hypothetical protein n=1 Tax=Pseudarthrobacter oxydans TaxID=1671 RepID=UPI00382C94D3